MKKTLMAVLCAGLLSSPVMADEWGYEGKHGPEHWGKFATLCDDGKNQSPVDIKGATQADLTTLDFNYLGNVVSVKNNGHTLQTSIEGSNTLTVDGKPFALKQFHFHTPSENLIDGETYPLEVHYVHADDQGNLAVVGVFFELGEHNDALSGLLERASKQRGITTVKPFSPKALFPNQTNYYRFSGSLTTPPCSEGVRWLVFQKPVTISKDQVDQFVELMGNNSRPVQPINARMIATN